MKVIALQASPNHDGLTASLAKSVLRGAEEAGANIELIHLNDCRINRCQACGSGWGPCRQGLDCVQKDSDDVETIRTKMIEADVVVFSTPVYFWDISESARTFLDRLRRVEWPQGESAPLAGKLFVAVAAAGGSGTGAPQAIDVLDNYARYLRMLPIAHLPVRRQNREIQLRAARELGRFVGNYLKEQ